MGHMAVTPPVDRSHWAGRAVLVTGAGGFVGSWLTKALVDGGAEVTVILRDEPHRSNLERLGLRESVNVVRGSITNLTTIQRTLNEHEIEVVFHLAAQATVGVANRSPLSTFESNIRGTWNLLEAVRNISTVTSTVIASSDKAYGSQAQLPYVEGAPLAARSPYDVSKACADMLAATYHHTYGLPVAVARCANIYGEGDLNFSRLVPGTIRSALKGEPPLIRSDGTPVRDYIHVDDAVSAYLVLAQRAGDERVMGAAFNFGANHPVSVSDLVQLILASCEREDLKPIIQDAIKPGMEIDRQYLDSSTALEVLEWSARTGLQEGLGKAIPWYRGYLQRD